ncbi:DUF6928 family protein [Corynebacterium suicordis]
MGFSGRFFAISDKTPREDVWSQPEGGRGRAEEMMQHLFGDTYAYSKESDVYDVTRSGDRLWIGNWGSTTIVAGDWGNSTPPVDLSEGFGTWELIIESSVDAFGYFVKGGPWGDRELEMDPDTGTDFESTMKGKSLPFEEPYFRGDHSMYDEDEDPEDQYPLPFHPLDLGNAALLWAFGIEAETPPNDDVVDPLMQDPHFREPIVMHEFALVKTPERKRLSFWGSK